MSSSALSPKTPKPTLAYRIKRAVLTIFGDIKVFPWPGYVVYHPSSFRVKGTHTRDIANLLQPGDVIMRGYLNYLDGYFIPKGGSGCSHSGVYVGEHTVLHSIAEGLGEIDVIDFCRADRIVVLRPASGQEQALEHAGKCFDDGIEYDFDFKPESGKYYCHEFTASCYPGLQIEMIREKLLFGLYTTPIAYLADSFFNNANFEKVYISDEPARCPYRSAQLLVGLVALGAVLVYCLG